jgi:anti-sigma regulatory factor (Ser/Thr protein kinase)
MAIETDIRLFEAADHVVHFYDSDDGLVGVLAESLGTALEDGESVVVVATGAHSEALEAALAAGGVDVVAAIAQERLVLLDAGETLARFTVDGAVDASRFDATVGELVRETAGHAKGIRIYGEMVSLLWEAGDVAGALHLEQLWNDLGATVGFSLLCGYPVRFFDESGPESSFSEVCHLHCGVVGGAPEPAPAEVVRRFGRTVHAPRLARRFVSEQLRGWGFDDLVDPALVVIDELVANAVIHARSDVAVGLSRLNRGVRLCVADSSEMLPVMRHPDATELNGRGMRLVSGLTDRWGHDVVDGGKRIWAELHGAGGNTGGAG